MKHSNKIIVAGLILFLAVWLYKTISFNLDFRTPNFHFGDINLQAKYLWAVIAIVVVILLIKYNNKLAGVKRVLSPFIIWALFIGLIYGAIIFFPAGKFAEIMTFFNGDEMVVVRPGRPYTVCLGGKDNWNFTESAPTIVEYFNARWQRISPYRNGRKQSGPALTGAGDVVKSYNNPVMYIRFTSADPNAGEYSFPIKTW